MHEREICKKLDLWDNRFVVDGADKFSVLNEDLNELKTIFALKIMRFDVK